MTWRLTVVVAYDISTDDTRAKVAALLQAYGDRIQRSVFLLTVAAEELNGIEVRLRELIDASTDSVYLLRQCAACWEERLCLGQAHPPEPVLYWAVL